MELLIFRHGPAGDKEKWRARGKPDGLRPLTADGRRKTDQAARGLAVLRPALDLVASSPLERARQTAQALRRRVKTRRYTELRELEPAAAPAETLRALKGLGKVRRLALVGHEPHLSSLVGLLVGDGKARLELKKAGACLLDVERLEPGGARLLWLLRPSQLRSLR